MARNLPRAAGTRPRPRPADHGQAAQGRAAGHPRPHPPAKPARGGRSNSEISRRIQAQPPQTLGRARPVPRLPRPHRPASGPARPIGQAIAPYRVRSSAEQITHYAMPLGYQGPARLPLPFMPVRPACRPAARGISAEYIFTAEDSYSYSVKILLSEKSSAVMVCP